MELGRPGKVQERVEAWAEVEAAVGSRAVLVWGRAVNVFAQNVARNFLMKEECLAMNIFVQGAALG